MADTAAHLVDHVLPSAPYRQWVLSLPKPLRLRLARHPAWTTWVGGLIVRAITAWQRRVARARHLAAPQTGAITFDQRFGGLVNLNVHFHLLVPDGVFTPTADDGLALALLPAPTGTDLLGSSIASSAASHAASPTRPATTTPPATSIHAPTCSRRSRPRPP
jgi:hypothetical protein